MALGAVLFDVFGTVVDWRRGVREAVAEFSARHGLALDAEAVALRWRALYQPAMTPIREGRRDFVPLDVLHAENLRIVLGEHGVDPDDLEERELAWLTRAWHRLPPWPDSVPGLRALGASVLIGPLSNGNVALLARMARHAGLPWDVVLGADVLRAYKPQPEAYRRAVALLDLDPAEVVMVAAHPDDLAAARRCGLRTAFVPRPEEYGPQEHDTGRDVGVGTPGEHDLVASDLVDLAARLTPWAP